MKQHFHVFLTTSFVLLGLLSHVSAAEPDGKILGEATNKSGDKILVRELFLPKNVSDKMEFHSPHCYRFEFYSLGFLQSCSTRWDDAPSSVKVRWTSSTKCNVSMLDGWLVVNFDKDAVGSNGSHEWTFLRRID
ncbi:MAG TPA: hypothetical protein VHG89_03230 [Verrucomicrobiae bacterium]|nr:hypothetical protein [Verrucomicrobiae bacterium]